MGCGASAEAGAVPSTLSSYGQKQRERLVAELWGLSPSVRRKRAEACGASDAEVDVAEDDPEDPKGAMVDLILKYEFELPRQPEYVSDGPVSQVLPTMA